VSVGGRDQVGMWVVGTTHHGSGPRDGALSTLNEIVRRYLDITDRGSGEDLDLTFVGQVGDGLSGGEQQGQGGGQEERVHGC